MSCLKKIALRALMTLAEVLELQVAREVVNDQ